MEKQTPNFFLRSNSGKVLEVPPTFKYLEIRSADNKVSHVFSVEGNQTLMFTQDDVEAVKYRAIFPDVEFCTTVDIEEIKKLHGS